MLQPQIGSGIETTGHMLDDVEHLLLEVGERGIGLRRAGAGVDAVNDIERCHAE